MPRPPREIDPSGTYHIIARGNNKSRLFHESSDFRYYYSLLGIGKRSYPFLLHHYALMPNHIHLLIGLNGCDLPKLMHQVQMNFARYYCKKYGAIGHVWQGRYKSIEIENDEQLFTCGLYIEMNPVRARIVRRPEDWEWSSYQFYTLAAQNEIIDPSPIHVSRYQVPGLSLYFDSQAGDAYGPNPEDGPATGPLPSWAEI